MDTTAILSKGGDGVDFSYKWTLRFSKNLIYFGDSPSKMCFMIRLEDLPKQCSHEIESMLQAIIFINGW